MLRTTYSSKVILYVANLCLRTLELVYLFSMWFFRCLLNVSGLFLVEIVLKRKIMTGRSGSVTVCPAIVKSEFVISV